MRICIDLLVELKIRAAVSDVRKLLVCVRDYEY